MADPGELDQFVRKFVNLWQSGRHAKLYVETEAGNAFVHLQVGLGQHEHPHHGQEHAGGRRSGGPARQRRRERRAASRQVFVSAEEAVTNSQAVRETTIADEAIEKVDDEIAEADVTEEDISNGRIPQINGTADGDAYYELKIEAHNACTESDVVEALEAKFYGTLDDENVEKNDPIRYIIVQHSNVESHLENEPRKILNYKVSVKENEIVGNIFEKWKERYKGPGQS
jgi:hypothetical protein